MAYENSALTDQPDGGHNQRALIGVGHEAAHEIDGKPQERSRFFADKLAIDRSRTYGFPVENVDIPGDVVARGKRPQLLADEFAKSALPRHCVGFLRMGKLILGESVNGVAQHFAVQRVLGLKVIVYCGLIDVSLCRKGPDAGRFIATFGK